MINVDASYNAAWGLEAWAQLSEMQQVGSSQRHTAIFHKWWTHLWQKLLLLGTDFCRLNKLAVVALRFKPTACKFSQQRRKEGFQPRQQQQFTMSVASTGKSLLLFLLAIVIGNVIQFPMN